MKTPSIREFDYRPVFQMLVVTNKRLGGYLSPAWPPQRTNRKRVFSNDHFDGI